MADEKGGGGFSIPWPAVMTLLAVAGGVYFFMPPLESSRPAGPPGQSTATVGVQDVDARLWEDPLKAAIRHHEQLEALALRRYASDEDQKLARATLEESRRVRQIAQVRSQIKLARAEGDPVVVLPVMIEGGPHAESTEARLRARQAIFEALAAARVTPDDGDHLNYFVVPWQRELQLEKCASGFEHVAATEPELIVPYEWCRYTGARQPPASQSSTDAVIAWGGDSGAGPALPTTAPVVVAYQPMNRADIMKQVKDRGGDKLQLQLYTVRNMAQQMAPPNVQQRAEPPPPLPSPPRPATQSSRPAASTRPTSRPIRLAQGSRPATRVLVLWLENSAFGDFPLHRLAQLFFALDPGPQRVTRSGEMNPAQFKVLGPRSSTTVRAMLREALNKGDKTLPFVQGQLGGVVMYSPTATADDDLLVNDFVADPARSASVRDLLTKAIPDLEFRRTIASDGVLCGALVDELVRRGIDPRPGRGAARDAPPGAVLEPGDTVALISEYDSPYGRSLPLSFVAATMQGPKRDEKVKAVDHLDPLAWPPNLRFVGYMRGIDGRIPGERVEGTPGGGGGTSDKPEQSGYSRAPLEQPLGTNQSDYLRRIVGNLRDIDTRSRAAGFRGLKAIGVLGSDVYDKLMVLQALRPQFPEVVFFTTDLDARLSHPKEWPQTHNLIVASAFGLKLKDYYQRDMAPFRDSYQTSLYASALKALDLLGENPETSPPRLFEIGRNGPVDISVGNFGHGISPEPPSVAESIPLDPKRQYMLAGLAALLVGLAVWTWLRWRGEQAEEKRPPVWPYGAFIVATAVMCFVVSLWHEGEAGEVFSWSAGVSIWPTQIIRLAAVLLCLHFFVKAAYELWSSDDDISVEFDIKPSGPPKENWRTAEFWRNRWSAVLESVRYRLFEGSTTREVWRSYLRAGLMRNRWARVVPRAVLFSLVSLWLMRALSERWVPARGDTARFVDRAMEYASILAVVTLIIFVADATRLCRALIAGLNHTKWPEDQAKLEAAARGVEPSDVENYLDVQLIAARTELVARLTLWPFLVVALLVLSRLSFFDDWDWPLAIVLLFGSMSLYALCVNLGMRREAEQIRTDAVRELKDVRANSDDDKRSQRLDHLIAELEAERRGAFSGIYQHPVVSTILLPSSGLGVWALLEYVAKLH